MRNKNNKIIAKFFSNRLSKREKSKFLKKASADKKFIKDFVKGIEVNEVIEEQFENENENKDQNKDSKGNSKSKLNIFLLIGLLSAATFIISAFIFSPTSSAPNTDRIFEEYYEPIPLATGTQRGEKEDAVRQIAEGIGLYLDQEYGSSIDHFRSLKLPESYQKHIRFYLGVAHIGAQNYSKAIEYLEPLNDVDVNFSVEIKWYLGLCYIKMDKLVEAKELLNQIPSKSFYSRDSQNLLKKLNP